MEQKDERVRKMKNLIYYMDTDMICYMLGTGTYPQGCEEQPSMKMKIIDTNRDIIDILQKLTGEMVTKLSIKLNVAHDTSISTESLVNTLDQMFDNDDLPFVPVPKKHDTVEEDSDFINVFSYNINVMSPSLTMVMYVVDEDELFVRFDDYKYEYHLINTPNINDVMTVFKKISKQRRVENERGSD